MGILLGRWLGDGVPYGSTEGIRMEHKIDIEEDNVASGEERDDRWWVWKAIERFE